MLGRPRPSAWHSPGAGDFSSQPGKIQTPSTHKGRPGADTVRLDACHLTLSRMAGPSLMKEKTMADYVTPAEQANESHPLYWRRM